MFNILRNKGEIIPNPDFTVNDGIVFLYASWSESLLYLKYLIGILEKYPSIKLYVYDIDDKNYNIFEKKYNAISHGKGETFWIQAGQIISKITDYKTEKDLIEQYTIELSDMG